MRRKKEHLVCQHLEKISKSALDKYQDVLKKLVKGRHGIYALYRKRRNAAEMPEMRDTILNRGIKHDVPDAGKVKKRSSGAGSAVSVF